MKKRKFNFSESEHVKNVENLFRMKNDIVKNALNEQWKAIITSKKGGIDYEPRNQIL